MTIVYVSIIIAVFLITGLLWGQMQVKNARRRGIYPAKDHATMEDVKRLALSGEVALAMRVYREIHGVSAKMAKKAVEQIVSSGGETD